MQLPNGQAAQLRPGAQGYYGAAVALADETQTDLKPRRVGPSGQASRAPCRRLGRLGLHVYRLALEFEKSREKVEDVFACDEPAVHGDVWVMSK